MFSEFLRRLSLNSRMSLRVHSTAGISSGNSTHTYVHFVHTHYDNLCSLIHGPLLPSTVNGRWCLAAGKVTVGLASHRPRVTDISGSPPTGSRPGRGRWAPAYVLLAENYNFTLLITAFPFNALTQLVGRQEGHPACIKLGVGLLMIWLELCTSYSSSCHHSPPPSSLASIKSGTETFWELHCY